MVFQPLPSHEQYVCIGDTFQDFIIVENPDPEFKSCSYTIEVCEIVTKILAFKRSMLTSSHD